MTAVGVPRRNRTNPRGASPCSRFLAISVGVLLVCRLSWAAVTTRPPSVAMSGSGSSASGGPPAPPTRAPAAPTAATNDVGQFLRQQCGTLAAPTAVVAIRRERRSADDGTGAGYGPHGRRITRHGPFADDGNWSTGDGRHGKSTTGHGPFADHGDWGAGNGGRRWEPKWQQLSWHAWRRGRHARRWPSGMPGGNVALPE